MDASRGHRIGPHSEFKGPYGYRQSVRRALLLVLIVTCMAVWILG
jgi:hypothetical protein